MYKPLLSALLVLSFFIQARQADQGDCQREDVQALLVNSWNTAIDSVRLTVVAIRQVETLKREDSRLICRAQYLFSNKSTHVLLMSVYLDANREPYRKSRRLGE